MSKRKKNYPDPLSVIQKYGADALRYKPVLCLVCICHFLLSILHSVNHVFSDINHSINLVYN